MVNIGTTRRTNPGGRYSKKLNADYIKHSLSPLDFYRHELPGAQIKRQGWNDGGLCPFHGDNQTGSFRINTDTGAFICFACDTKGGDIIAFAMALHGIEFRDALAKLADERGFKQGIEQNWKHEDDYPKHSDQRADFLIEAHRQKLIRQQEELAKHKAAANRAAYIWCRATPAPATHPYFIKKRIKPHGARLSCDDRLIIPLENSEGQLVNLQFISATGEKRFLYGGLKKGCFHILDGKTDAILICEGAATGFSLFEATGHLTLIAFDAGNLKNVAINIKALYPSSDIVICGDNDLSGIGQQKAIETALAINGKYIIPATLGQDWNDALTMEVNHA